MACWDATLRQIGGQGGAIVFWFVGDWSPIPPSGVLFSNFGIICPQRRDNRRAGLLPPGRASRSSRLSQERLQRTAPMEIHAILPPKGRDLRLDLFRGVANWAIFLDHIPDNVVNWITTRNYGFSDAADLLVFFWGYTASFVYARMMLERGFIVGATRLTKRVWQL